MTFVQMTHTLGTSREPHHLLQVAALGDMQTTSIFRCL